jgi:hypothetical protein
MSFSLTRQVLHGRPSQLSIIVVCITLLSQLISAYPRQAQAQSTPCDSYEPNDSRFLNPFGPLGWGVNYAAKLCNGDSEDNYYFETSTLDPVKIALTLPPTLIGKTSILVYSPDNLAKPFCYIAEVPTAPFTMTCTIQSTGRYIVRLYTLEGDFDNTNPYLLNINPSSSCDTYEPNNYRFEDVWGPLLPGTSYQALLCEFDPEDNYWLEASAGNSIHLSLTLPSSLVGKTSIWLYDADSNQQSPICGTGQISSGQYSALCPISHSGKYTVRLYATRGTFDKTNAYTLTTDTISINRLQEFLSTIRGRQFCDSYEPNNDRYINPSPITTGVTVSAQFCGEDEDNYSFVWNSEEPIQIRVSLPVEAQLWLYRESDVTEELRSSPSDTELCGGTFQPGTHVTHCKIPRPGTYIVRLYNFDNLPAGTRASYTLIVSSIIGSQLIVNAVQVCAPHQTVPSEITCGDWRLRNRQSSRVASNAQVQ